MHACMSLSHPGAACTTDRWQCRRCARWFCTLHLPEEGELCEDCFVKHMMERTAALAEVNDRFRQSGIGGQVFVTDGVISRGERFVNAALGVVRRFEEFTPANDPWHEHDFGSFDLEGTKLFWKIDYYDAAMEYGSNDPANPDITTRVLTIMLAEEF